MNINDIIRLSLDLLQRSLPKDIEIVTRLDESLPLTNADPSQMQQLMINLAVNARDAMPDGGKLILETSLVGRENGLSRLAPSEESGFVKLSVSDTGMGIDSETQAKIFDPFFTTKDVGKGTGLGLYIVHSIVNNHGGYINLYSEPGKGTRFNIYLPVAKGIVAEQAKEAVDVRGRGTILVIDDEPDVRELCKDSLTLLGYTVLIAENAGRRHQPLPGKAERDLPGHPRHDHAEDGRERSVLRAQDDQQRRQGCSCTLVTATTISPGSTSC